MPGKVTVSYRCSGLCESLCGGREMCQNKVVLQDGR